MLRVPTHINPLTAGPKYISFFHFSIGNIFANMSNLIDRVSEAQIEVSENFN